MNLREYSQFENVYINYIALVTAIAMNHEILSLSVMS